MTGKSRYNNVHMEIPDKIRDQISELPKNPGIYFFKNSKGQIMYVGKATSLRDRVRSYWSNDLNRGPAIERMVSLVSTIDHEQRDSAMEALIAEANYIKKLLPKYNIQFRDDKSYFYVKLDNSDGTDFPRLSLVHKNQILLDEKNIRYFGPYTSSRNLRLALKIIRKIFPYRSCTVMPHKACLQYHIKRCPAPCISNVEKQEYRKAIKRIVLILEGKKDQLMVSLKKEMEALAKKQQFEAAAAVRNQYLALQHLREAAKIFDTDIEHKPRELALQNVPRRIEGYDVSNTSGREATVSMVVFLHGRPAKHLYKRFRIKTVEGPNDYSMLQEAIERRLQHAHLSTQGEEEMVSTRTWDFSDDESWQLPDLMIIDGGRGQLSAASLILDQAAVQIPLIGMAKGPDRKNEDLYFSNSIDFKDITVIRAVRDEAHRFAYTYHRLLREKRLIRSDLDAVPGIGPVRKKLLLRQFGSVQAIKKASFDELASAVGSQMAKVLTDHFHPD